MIKENARPFTLQDSDKALWVERIWLVAAVFGSFEPFGIYASKKEVPVLVLKAFCMFIFSPLMMSPDFWPYALEITFFGTAFGSVGWIVCLCVNTHLDYGTEMFGPIFGSFLTAGAVGSFAFNQVLFAQIFDSYATTNSLTGV